MTLPAEPRTGGADLHIHSDYSDGSLSPEELLNCAEKADLECISLTDHDTVEGMGPLMDSARHSTVDVIPGVELSCQIEQGRYHVLGYFIDWEKPGFRKRLKYYEDQRARRVKEMTHLIREHFDSELTYENVASFSNRSLICKPHVAEAMVEDGLVDSFQQAFDQYLGEGKLLDRVPKERMGLREAIGAIEEVGGIPILAHPVHYDEPLSLQRFSQLGIRGVEVYYPDQNRTTQETLYEEAQQLDWIVTGGSDFHGEPKPKVSMGEVRLPVEFLNGLKRAAKAAGSRRDFPG